MPVSNDKKRKLEKGGKASPTKKAKVSGTKGKKAGTPNAKKAAASKVIASKVKKSPEKASKSAKPASKSKPVAKKASPVKGKTAGKQNGKKVEKKPANNKKASTAAKTVTRGKLDSVVKSKNQSAASKAKAAAVKNLTKANIQKGKKPEIKKSKTAPSKQKLEKPKVVPKAAPKKAEEKTKGPAKNIAAESSVRKRKISENKEESSDESPRKRRVITPNKKYADFEVNVSTKRVSELRAFIQDKRKTTEDETPTKEQKTPKQESPKAVPVKKAPAKPKKVESDDNDDEEGDDIKIIKPSEMKPAEKLLKKLQKKLEKEAKAASSFKPKADVKDKTKITKVVTYNKPKTKISTIPIKALAQTPKLPRSPKVSTGVIKSASKETPKSKVKVVKVTPKVSTPEKVVKPKKIKEMKREERPIQLKLAYQKNIKQKDDQDCWITGIDIFPSGEIIMVDISNKKIKLFNKNFDECLSSVKLDTIPQDISVSPVDASSAYFTKPFSKEGIQKISMSDGKLTLKESFFTNGTNRGIKCTKSGILTSVQDGRYHDLDINCFKIDHLDYEGKSLKTVSVDLSGSRLFKLPLYFTTSHNDKQIIVSDCIRQNSYIVSLDLTGKIKFKHTGMLAPRGLTVDNHDNVFVTEWEQNNVYVLSPTGKRLQVLITDQECKDDGLDGLLKPYQLCFLPNDQHGQLIVSQEGKNTIKVFNISRLPDKAEAASKEEKTGVESPKKNVESPKKSVESPQKVVEMPEKDTVEAPTKTVEASSNASSAEENPETVAS